MAAGCHRDRGSRDREERQMRSEQDRVKHPLGLVEQLVGLLDVSAHARQGAVGEQREALPEGLSRLAR